MLNFRSLSCIALGLLLSTAASAAEPLDFVHEVVPILRRHCVTCHGGREKEGDFSINTRASVLESGAVDLDAPSDSYLLDLVTSDDPEAQMPPSDRPRVPAEEIAVLRRWIAEGLPWDEEFTFAINTYEPPLRPRRVDLPPPIEGRTNPIDRILDAYLAQHDLPRPDEIDDATFLRRAHLDLIGLLPTPQQLEAFAADDAPDKRERLVDELLADKIAYADHWLTFFNDLLRNDYSGTGFITGGRRQISKWLYESLLQNKPFDAFAAELIAPPTPESRGYIDGIKWRGEVSAGQTLPVQFAQSVTQSFLGINMKCASCHDSFIDRWTLEEAYGLAAIYAGQPLELYRCDKPTGQTAQAAWLFPELGQIEPQAPAEQQLQQLAELMTHPENGRFTRTIVNRLWYKLMGRGIVHPLDAMQHEPWNDDLLDFLAVHFAQNDYDLKATLRLIATSQAYQSQTEIVTAESTGDDYIYRGPRARRMSAEQFLDAVWQLTGAAPQTFDAPVFRSDVDPEVAAALDLEAKWIWGRLADNAAPAGEQILLRRQIDLPADVEAGGAIITCDNSFRLFVGRREVTAGDDWTKLQTVVLSSLLKKGANELLIIAANAGSAPNPAGLYFDARLRLVDGQSVTITSDESWEWHPDVPATREGRIGPPGQGWRAVSVAAPVGAWTDVVERTARPLLAAVMAGGTDAPMVRAALLRNTPLMQSLGRPIRDQIVSMRPTTLTTLEAIDLANEPGLAGMFAAGAQRLLQQEWESTDALIEHIFGSALTRSPSDEERSLFREALGDDPGVDAVQDALWAVCMLPEFLLIR
jgi:hypothetical protein